MEEDEDGNKTVKSRRPVRAEDTGASTKHEAYLIVIAGATLGKTHKLPDRGEVIVGRADDATIRIDDEEVSRSHARISITPNGRVTLADLGSTNGTYVNGVKIVEQRLQNGDKVQVGSHTILKFQYQDALEEEFQRKLFESAVKDGLTGVYNKKYFLDRIQADFAYARRHRTPLTLLLFDIDHFKQINDMFGHAAGDDVLKQLAALVKRAIRSEDILARFGGEEFVILMRDVDNQTAPMLAERLRQLVEQTVFEFRGARIAVTISLGFSTMSTSAEPALQHPADLVRQADQYLYDAKRAGRNRVAGMPVNQPPSFPAQSAG